MSDQPRRHLKRYEVNHQPRFLTFSCYRRLALFNNDNIKHYFVEELRATKEEMDFDLIAWVIMPEHIHLLLTPNVSTTPVPSILERLKTDFARVVTSRWKSVNAPILERITRKDEKVSFWQRGGGYDRNIRDEDELREKRDYIHNNPCKRGLVESPLDWRWSSARFHVGLAENVLAI